jgi:hypothetical protein
MRKSAWSRDRIAATRAAAVDRLILPERYAAAIDEIEQQLDAEARLHTPRPADEWTEEHGDVLWWHLPIEEPPIVGAHACMGEMTRTGRPTDCRRLQEEGWLTHWTPLPSSNLIQENWEKGTR